MANYRRTELKVKKSNNNIFVKEIDNARPYTKSNGRMRIFLVRAYGEYFVVNSFTPERALQLAISCYIGANPPPKSPKPPFPGQGGKGPKKGGSPTKNRVERISPEAAAELIRSQESRKCRAET